MSSGLFAAGVSGIVGLVASPLIHLAIRVLGAHFPVRKVGLSCAQCGTAIPSRARFGGLSAILGAVTCANCGNRYWPYAGWLEVGTFAFMAFVGFQLGWSAALPAYLVFFLCAIAITVIDLRQYVIPTKLVYLAVIAGLINFTIISAVTQDWSRLITAAATMLGLRFFYFIFWFFFPAGMGFGDVRLATAVGLFTGWIGVGNAVIALFVGLLTSSAVGLFMVLVRMRTMKSAIPHGPFMLVGATAAIIFAGHWASVLS